MIEAAPSIPTDPVDVVADALDGREDVVVVGSDQVDLSRQARGALSKCRVTGVPAEPTRCSPGCCWRRRTLPFANAVAVADRN